MEMDPHIVSVHTRHSNNTDDIADRIINRMVIPDKNISNYVNFHPHFQMYQCNDLCDFCIYIF